jgi:hypothetical protein
MKNEQILDDIAGSSPPHNLHELRRMARPKPQHTKTTPLKPIISAIAVAAVVGLCTPSSGWATSPSSATTSGTHQETTAQADNPQVQQINSYVRDVEKNVSSYKRNEEKLSSGQLKEVTDKEWSKIHTYTDGDNLKRLKLYPSDGSRMEEKILKESRAFRAAAKDKTLAQERH